MGNPDLPLVPRSTERPSPPPPYSPPPMGNPRFSPHSARTPPKKTARRRVVWRESSTRSGRSCRRPKRRRWRGLGKNGRRLKPRPGLSRTGNLVIFSAGGGSRGEKIQRFGVVLRWLCISFIAAADRYGLVKSSSRWGVVEGAGKRGRLLISRLQTRRGQVAVTVNAWHN